MVQIEIKDLERPEKELNSVEMQGIYGGFFFGSLFSTIGQGINQIGNAFNHLGSLFSRLKW
ncbi:hypothetical protein [Bacillus sp. Marseille-P3661]|uniref:hypothetical protein n=1 Tax=Bacillus sp. Marseille-P3661 TaxID=1936234 RepID=UPI000C84B4C3|nr:hypothetical protein [Bacillus sp. Marseille-P3661]